jgi:hypothetical protein
MKSKTIKIIYILYFLLVILFIFQELFPILFILPINPNISLIAMNFPLSTGIILALIPIFTARSFIKSPEQDYNRLSLIKAYFIILIISALISLFLPYVTYIGVGTDIGLIYSIYGGLLGLVLTIFGYIQLIVNRIFFGFLIGTAGSALGLSNHFRFFLYVLQQSNTRVEIGFYIGLITWVILFLLNLGYTFRSYFPNQIH